MMMRRSLLIIAVLFVLAIAGHGLWGSFASTKASGATGDPPSTAPGNPSSGATTQPTSTSGQGKVEFPVASPPFSQGVYPCSTCHNADMPPRPKRRVMKLDHKDIRLHHDEANRWCLDCHSADDRNVLHSASGAIIPFAESYRLCGQCHGDKYRDWKAGIHGKRTGQWNGKKQYLLCVNCHNPHSPKFKPIAPMAPPVPPVSREGTAKPSDEKRQTP
jgi:hypothetical protein